MQRVVAADKWTEQGRKALTHGESSYSIPIETHSSPEAIQWDGWGTALKPALEPITVARKPLEGNTVADNVLKHGTGAINIDGCRVGSEIVKTQAKNKGSSFSSVGDGRGFNGCPESFHTGRWPANLIHDGSDEVLQHFPDDEESSAARFFYCPKTQQKDRNKGLEDFETKQTIGGGGTNNTEDDVCGKYGSIKAPNQNNHPTVKPTELMKYLCRLVTPPGGIVLDPFMGSGSTGKAAQQEDFHFIGFEIDSSYFKIAESRINTATKGQQLLLFKNNEYTLLA